MTYRNKLSLQRRHWVIFENNKQFPFFVATAFSWVLFIVVLANSAWVAEDAFITFRSVLNFVNGYGPVWNIGERVQVFTHPLWFLLLSLAKSTTGYLVYASLFLSMIFALVSLVILQITCLNRWTGVMLIVALASSKAFVEYSSSGLENALGALLLGCFCWLLFYKPSLWPMTFTASLLALCRMDFVLLTIPSLALIVWQQRKDTIQLLATIITATLPLTAWLLFSLIYYGSPLPNTYYAKLPDGFSRLLFVKQSWNYFRDCAINDHISLLLIATGSLAGLLFGDIKTRLLVIGELFYLCYIVWIGGDYMTGRFFMIPTYVAALLLARTLKKTNPIGFITLSSAAIAICMHTKLPILNNSMPKITSALVFSSRNIINERAGWWPTNSWLDKGSTLSAFEFVGNHWHYSHQSCVTPMLAVGAAGLTVGPDFHIIDFVGITDPLLSHLPADHFFPGHFSRKIPKGYIASVETKTNSIADSNVAKLYDLVKETSTGDLWSITRWTAIAELLKGDWRPTVAHYHENKELSFSIPTAILISNGWLQKLRDNVITKDITALEKNREAFCPRQYNME